MMSLIHHQMQGAGKIDGLFNLDLWHLNTPVT